MTPTLRARRVVIAPDSFKGTINAGAAAEAIARGWASVCPADTLIRVPMADGGEGTVDAIAAAHPDAERIPITVTGPDGSPVHTSWLRYRDGPGVVGVVELANTSGITLLDELLPFDAHTLGFGEAIVAALDAGIDRLVLAIGGSSSTDAGTGLLRALGAILEDSAGQPIPLGNRGLSALARADLTTLRALPSGGVTVITDVTSPLLGATGAAHMFGKQKGASSEERTRLDTAVANAASVLGGEPANAGAGAAGGAGYGLALWGATLAPGAQAIGGELGLERTFAGADIVLTGEGRFDEQSAAGKVPSYVRSLAAQSGASTGLIAGSIGTGVAAGEGPDGFHAIRSLSELAGGVPNAMAHPERWLAEAGSQLAKELSAR
ncbi:glycerate kinase [Lysinibacter cavernae]|uniref:Glycerate kinase n=1 Tax=Lysinibacter cavernae TaxID=1640652 RepID=A0A7X5R3S1_9MICO|nr:glycerate kinase [Lysinibacter cavernae]NIH55031.1 glycerate kinase [Lysinibacter cavernae]